MMHVPGWGDYVQADPKHRWREFVKRVGGHQQWADSGFTILQKLYGEPHRHYHTMTHIQWCLDLLYDFFAPEARPVWYDHIELALWFHDVIYDPRAPNNEECSAKLLEGFALLQGLPEKLAADAAFSVRATKHTGENLDGMPVPTQWVLDIDLASLGFEPKRFDENSAQIREEYSWVPEDAYRAGRKTILQGFLDRPRIYLTDPCHARFEAQARENLKKAIERLG